MTDHAQSFRKSGHDLIPTKPENKAFSDEKQPGIFNINSKMLPKVTFRNEP